VAADIPEKPARPEQKAPVTKATAVCQLTPYHRSAKTTAIKIRDGVFPFEECHGSLVDLVLEIYHDLVAAWKGLDVGEQEECEYHPGYAKERCIVYPVFHTCFLPVLCAKSNVLKV
jgi:hypothetical protein